MGKSHYERKIKLWFKETDFDGVNWNRVTHDRAHEQADFCDNWEFSSFVTEAFFMG
jgi:hypothetical protein